MKQRWHIPLVLSLLLLGTVIPATAANAAGTVTDPAAIVNPFLGTSNGGDTFPGADAPFGMVQWSPDTPSRPASGNYAYGDSTITGFSLDHISGAGCNAEADIPILPTVGGIDANATSSFSHSTESASAGAYAVTLGNGVRTELTATTRTGMARFTFPTTNQANVLFKLGSAATSQSNIVFTVVNNTEVSGQITSGHFCASGPTYTIYFDLVFDRSFASSSAFTNGGAVTFDSSSNHVVQAKVGISYVSLANAIGNRTAENPNWNFDTTKAATHTAWNNYLSRIAITGGTSDQQVVFYTSLYHSLLHPNVVSDTNGQYRGFDHTVHSVSGSQGAQYATVSGWDIYRSQAQLEALVAPAVASDTAQSLVNDYNQGGFLPKWSLNEYETYVMNGDPSPAIIADYYAFGARNFDTATAKTAMIHQGTINNPIRTGLDFLSNYGYLPSDGTYPYGFYGSVATTLEYSSEDFAISAFAGALGDTTSQAQFANRAQNWKNVLNPSSGLMQPKLENGTWRSGFDATSSDQFVEGTSWQYTGMVPYNVGGLAAAKGGNAALASYLDSVLSNFHGSGGSHSDMGNEPSIELPWEYDYIGQPWKTQSVVRAVQDQLWPNSDANWGVGNDDLGTMSAWYVFSALGMFPETPGTSDLALGSPLFTQAVVKLPSGNTLTINGNGAADNAPYVQSATFNGSAWNNAYAPPLAITAGGTLNFTLGTSANTSWATGASAAPPSYGGNGGAGPVATQEGPTGALTSGIAGKCLDLNAGNTASGTAIQIYGCNNTAAQKWKLTGDGTIMLGTKCLDISGGGTGNGSKVQLWDCNLGNGQYFVYNAATKQFRNPASNRCLDVPGTNDGTQLDIWDCNSGTNQQWTLPVAHLGAIPSALAGKCIDDNAASTSDGSHIQLWDCNNSSAQKFAISGDGTLRVFGRCVDITGGGTTNGTLLVLWDCSGGANQQWTYNATTGAFQNPASGRCIDDPTSSMTNGTQLQIWDCNNTNAQHWTMPS